MLQILAPALVLLNPASQSPPDPEWNCDNPMRQQEMNWCAANDYAEADEALNAQWRKTSAKMKARDESVQKYLPEGDGRPGYFQSLLEAQCAWLTYRDAHCRVDGYTARGGSLEPLLVSTCKTGLTEARTAELWNLANNPE
ncbi:MAG: lysozyme inhibitor LprI family protein [Erythrobacter sp.]